MDSLMSKQTLPPTPSFLNQGWLQHQGASGIRGAARVCGPEPRPSTTVRKKWLHKSKKVGPSRRRGAQPDTSLLQAVSVELPLAGRSPEDRPYDGGVCLALLPVQPWSVPVDRSDPQLRRSNCSLWCKLSDKLRHHPSGLHRDKNEGGGVIGALCLEFIVLLSKNEEESPNNPGRETEGLCSTNVYLLWPAGQGGGNVALFEMTCFHFRQSDPTSWLSSRFKFTKVAKICVIREK